MQSLNRLGPDADQDAYTVVPRDDPRPRFVHGNYKLSLHKHGTAWRIVDERRMSDVSNF